MKTAVLVALLSLPLVIPGSTNDAKSTCMGLEDGVYSLQFWSGKETQPVSVRCSKGYAILNYEMDSNLELYFSSFETLDWGSNQRIVHWENNFLSRDDLMKCALSLDCTTCDVSEDAGADDESQLCRHMRPSLGLNGEHCVCVQPSENSALLAKGNGGANDVDTLSFSLFKKKIVIKLPKQTTLAIILEVVIISILLYVSISCIAFCYIAYIRRDVELPYHYQKGLRDYSGYGRGVSSAANMFLTQGKWVATSGRMTDDVEANTGKVTAAVNYESNDTDGDFEPIPDGNDRNMTTSQGQRNYYGSRDATHYLA